MVALSLRPSLRLFLLVALLGNIVSACSLSPSLRASKADQTASTAAVAEASAGMTADRVASDNVSAANLQAPAAPAIPRSQPQLVKTGTLTIAVDSVAQAIEKTTAIVRQQQGDLLQLQDQLPDDPGSHHLALLQVRVPQQNLEALLKSLTQIGTLQQQTLATEDVSSQLVDYQARLRNLRKTEATLLEIMTRSGSISDVLKVAQELSNVRNSIEQIDAQLKDLQSRVAYSIVTLNLQETTTTLVPQPKLETQVQETWEQATHSVSSFTVSLMKLGLWLLAYSPYWLALVLGVIGLRRLRLHPRTGVTEAQSGENP